VWWLEGTRRQPGGGGLKGTCKLPGDAHEVRKTAPPAQPVGLDAPIQNAVYPKQRAAPRAALCFNRCCEVGGRTQYRRSIHGRFRCPRCQPDGQSRPPPPTDRFRPRLCENSSRLASY